MVSKSALFTGEKKIPVSYPSLRSVVVSVDSILNRLAVIHIFLHWYAVQYRIHKYHTKLVLYEWAVLFFLFNQDKITHPMPDFLIYYSNFIFRNKRLNSNVWVAIHMNRLPKNNNILPNRTEMPRLFLSENVKNWCRTPLNLTLSLRRSGILPDKGFLTNY